ncbi:hypothetical protein SPRG_05420, partial [Saprolegnia parasitica CBS 223.65]
MADARAEAEAQVQVPDGKKKKNRRRGRRKPKKQRQQRDGPATELIGLVTDAMAVEAAAVLEPAAPALAVAASLAASGAGSSALAAVAAIGTVLEPAAPELAVVASPAASGTGSSAIGTAISRRNRARKRDVPDINPGTKGANATGTCVREALMATFRFLKGQHNTTITSKLIDNFLVEHENLELGKGVPDKSYSALLDFLRKHGFDIDRQIYGKSLLKQRARDDKQNDIITTCETPGAYHVVTFEDPGFRQHLMAVRVREEKNGKISRCYFEDSKWKALSTLRFVRSTTIRSICRVQLKDNDTTTHRTKPIEPNATDHTPKEVIDLTSDNEDGEPKKRQRFAVMEFLV